MRTEVKDIGMVILGIVIIVAVFMAVQRADKYMQIKAMTECAQASSFTYESRGNGENGEQTMTRTLDPNRAFYKVCMDDLGYKTNIKE
ncbi:hypothetical protein A2W14_01580 [Candidatus Gottesmanbacteria bacterium RBG_16_37_8]|uniref:Uncharacterized protein n=1 Tax=Candidatus Gottesmanbacteria bacterium RBG_16_37_8 TaxID=1798371 RepID=A0A1F5YQT7_9BACT|nr:MAG: hypothetical protein A2W14_01580 [Candidatus Gottesmanbacteria bacterium RBG_16_37_8]